MDTYGIKVDPIARFERRLNFDVVAGSIVERRRGGRRHLGGAGRMRGRPSIVGLADIVFGLGHDHLVLGGGRHAG